MPFLMLTVGPYVGPWIEICEVFTISLKRQSGPTWARGLKFSTNFPILEFSGSGPTWARGLK